MTHLSKNQCIVCERLATCKVGSSPYGGEFSVCHTHAQMPINELKEHKEKRVKAIQQQLNGNPVGAIVNYIHSGLTGNFGKGI